MRCADLVEAEGRDLRRNAARFALGIIGALGGGVLAVAGFVLLFIGLYLFLAPSLGPAGAVVVTGTVLLLAGGSLIWGMRTLMR